MLNYRGIGDRVTVKAAAGRTSGQAVVEQNNPRIRRDLSRGRSAVRGQNRKASSRSLSSPAPSRGTGSTSKTRTSP